MSRKKATLTVEVIFDGDYYELDELVDLVEFWLDGALEDRDDVMEWEIVRPGTAVEIPPGAVS